ncbi:hypothetical protein JL722_789 [Aureococcus anophagefferens]|nr:hypothetical protein JL722_789 [Aureococcus anophagefferens]
MSTFGDLFFNSVVLGGRGRRDAPDDASSSDGCGGDDDVELSLADDDASDGCRGAMLEADLRLEQEAHLATRQLLARSTAELGRLRDSQALALVEAAKASAKISAAERDAALSRASDAEEAARFSASEAFEKLCADAYALGGSSDRDDDDRKVGRCELRPALKETRRGEDVDDPASATRKRMGGGGAMVKSNTQSVLVLCAHDLPLPKQRTIDDLNEMGTDLTGVYDYKLDAVAAATIDLATALFAEKLEGAAAPRSPGRPEDRVLVVTSGGKDDWRDVLSRAEVLQREFTRRVGIDAAEYTARLLAKRDLSSVTVVVSPAADAAAARRVFEDALPPGVDVEIASPADRAAKKRRVS